MKKYNSCDANLTKENESYKHSVKQKKSLDC